MTFAPYPFQTLPQPPPTTPTLKRSRSSSPTNLAKKRPPANYVPSIYTQLPPHVARELSVDLNGSGRSGSASPGGDWVTRTEGLQLATPPPGSSPAPQAYEWEQHHQRVEEHDMDEDVGMGGSQDDTMDADDDLNASHPPRPAVSSHHLASQLHSPFHHSYRSQHGQPPEPPHHAPPLHDHLAGSPQPLSHDSTGNTMSRSSSTSSSHSGMSLSPQHYRQHGGPLPGVSPLPQTVPMPVSPQRRVGGGGGWKVTMGYRADCEKCVNRVEGHYSHVKMDGGNEGARRW